jgi:hypothetical protein
VAVIFADPTTGDLDSVISDTKLKAVIHALLWSHHKDADLQLADSVEVKLEADSLISSLRESCNNGNNDEDEEGLVDNDVGEHHEHDDGLNQVYCSEQTEHNHICL